MEQLKITSFENAPYNADSNYTISFDIQPALYDGDYSYMNIPVSIGQTYTEANQANLANCIANPFLNSPNNTNNYTASQLIKSVSLKLDEETKVYTQDFNRLACGFDFYAYDYAEQETEAFFSGLQINGNKEEVYTQLTSSPFRNLNNVGTSPSTQTIGRIRIKLSKLLPSLCNGLVDFRKYRKVSLVLQLDTLLTVPTEKQYYAPTTAGESVTPVVVNNINIIPLMGYTNNVIPIQTQAAGNDTTILFVTPMLYDTMPFGVGDIPTISTNNPDDATIVSFLPAGVTVGGMCTGFVVTTANANPSGGNITACTPTFKVVKVTAQLDRITSYWPIGSNFSLTAGNVVKADVNGSTNLIISKIVDEDADVVTYKLIVLSKELGTAPAGGTNYTIGNPALVLGNVNNGASLNNLVTTGNFTKDTLQLYVGSAVLISGTGVPANYYQRITGITYPTEGANIGKAVLTFSNPANATANTANVNLRVVLATTLPVTYIDKWEMVLFRKVRPPTEIMPKDFTKWVMTSDALSIGANQTQTKSMEVMPLTKMIIISLCQDGSYRSILGSDAVSYMLQLDGKNLFSRYITIGNGDGKSFYYDRLIEGYKRMSNSEIHALSTTYTTFIRYDSDGLIMQAVPVDGKPHILTLIFRNGANALNLPLRMYSCVIDKL